jgi:hypothetical protein
MHERHPNILEHHGILFGPFFDSGVYPADLIAQSGAMGFVPLEGGDNIGLRRLPNEQARRHAPRVFNS